jgi:hypothetical protein
LRILREDFEVFEPVDKFDTLLDFQTGSVVYGGLFDVSKVVIGDDKDPERKFECSHKHLENKPKIYKSFNPIFSAYEKFSSYPKSFEYPVIDNNEKEEILVSEESKEFLRMFKQSSFSTNPDNIFSYNIESTNIEFITLLSSSNEKEEIVSPLLSTMPSEKIINNQTKETVNNNIEKISNYKDTSKIIEKTWQSILEKKIDSKTIKESNNTISKIEEIVKDVSKVNNNNNYFSNLKTNNTNTINNINNNQNITNNEINQVVNQVEKKVIQQFDTKINEAIIQINQHIHEERKDMFDEFRKIVKSNSEENSNNQKKIINNVDKTLKDFLRS